MSVTSQQWRSPQPSFRPVDVSFSALLPGVYNVDSKVEEADSCGVNLQKSSKHDDLTQKMFYDYIMLSLNDFYFFVRVMKDCMMELRSLIIRW